MLKPYVKYNGHTIIEVRCKGDCDTVVARRDPNGELCATPEYTSLILETSVDSVRDLLGHHETIVCRACADRILALAPKAMAAELATIYAQDVYQWIVSATTVARPRVAQADAERMAAPFAAYVPLRVVLARSPA